MPNVTREELRRLEDIEKRYIKHMTSKELESFTHEFLQMLGMVLANTPYEFWPKEAKLVLGRIGQVRNYELDLYKENLPKE